MIYIVIYSVLLIDCLLVLWGSLKNGGSKSATIVAYSFFVWVILCIIFYVHKYVTSTDTSSITTTSERFIDDDGYIKFDYDYDDNSYPENDFSVVASYRPPEECRNPTPDQLFDGVMYDGFRRAFETYSYADMEPTSWQVAAFNNKVITPEQHDQFYVAKMCTCRLLRSGCTYWQQICGRDWEWSVQFLLSLSPMYAHEYDDWRCKWKRYSFSMMGLYVLSWYGRFENCWDREAVAPMLEKE